MKCKDCGSSQENPKSSCDDALFIHINGVWQLRIQSEHKCACGAGSKGFHHYGCEKELCPICNNQLVSCNCKKDKVGTISRVRDI